MILEIEEDEVEVDPSEFRPFATPRHTQALLLDADDELYDEEYDSIFQAKHTDAVAAANQLFGEK